jgi:hypothetical protein
LENVDFETITNCEDVNEALYVNFSREFLQVADKHEPFKQRRVLPNQVPYMNVTLTEKSNIYEKNIIS